MAAHAAVLALVLALILIKHGLAWIALRRLRPLILHRMALPEGHRIRAPMRLGMVYHAAKGAGWLAVGYILAPLLHLILILIDRGWQGSIALMLGVVLALGGLLFGLDRFLGRRVREICDLPPDWRARSR